MISGHSGQNQQARYSDRSEKASARPRSIDIGAIPDGARQTVTTILTENNPMILVMTGLTRELSESDNRKTLHIAAKKQYVSASLKALSSQRDTMRVDRTYNKIISKINDPELDFDNLFLDKALENPIFLDKLLISAHERPELMPSDRKDKIIKYIEVTQNKDNLAVIWGKFLHKKRGKLQFDYHLTLEDVQTLNSYIRQRLAHIMLPSIENNNVNL